LLEFRQTERKVIVRIWTDRKKSHCENLDRQKEKSS